MLLLQHKKIAAAVIPLALMTLAAGIVLHRSLAAEPKAPDKDAPPVLIRSAQSGPWSAPATWEGGKVPAAGAKVQVRAGHTVIYDVESDDVIRSLHLAGVLTFTHDKDTQLDVGLIKVQAGDNTSEEGFDCDAHLAATASAKPQAALEVGSAEQPIGAGHTALIRLHYVEGMNKESCPAIVCCGGRMDFHGAPMSRTWVKLGATAEAGKSTITLAEPVTGWRVGERILLTATTRQNKVKKTFRASTRDNTQTEERTIQALDGTTLTLDKPLTYEHVADGDYRGDVANLSRNVIFESADPTGERGHTMYHRGSAGSISYAEFRHLGKEGVLGRYSLHFHLAGDTMRGSSVIGASIWDSGNRWVTIHGTNYLIVRDCVGYQSMGHGFFLEDGTEVFNVLDRNLAVQAYIAKPLPRQVMPFDKNDGSGFWWANSLNTFTRNTAAECDEYGYFFQAAQTPDFDLSLPIQQPDGSRKKVDIRTLPFFRFEDNEAHCQRRHAFNLGGGVPFGEPNVAGVGPDERHPFVIRSFKAWNVHWAIHPVSPSVLLDGLAVHNAEYGVWRAVYKDHAYRGLHFEDVPPMTRNAFPTGTQPSEESFPRPLQPVDDLPPVTVITHAHARDASTVIVRGTTADNGTVKKVVVNGTLARLLPGGGEWEAVLTNVKPHGLEVKAYAEDDAGNVETRPHVATVGP
jgi:hypothetical protein